VPLAADFVAIKIRSYSEATGKNCLIIKTIKKVMIKMIQKAESIYSNNLIRDSRGRILFCREVIPP
jgi:hypothetical protein